MTEVNILMISGLLGYTVQRDILKLPLGLPLLAHFPVDWGSGEASRAPPSAFWIEPQPLKDFCFMAQWNAFRDTKMHEI